MTDSSAVTLSPAQVAAETAFAHVRESIDNRNHFLVEAGAGAGKTYTLIEALQYVIERKTASLSKLGQQVACITYTNVAADEIRARIRDNPLVVCSTIHAYCWSLIRAFQPAMRVRLKELEPWQTRIAESGAIDHLPIRYELGYPSIEQHEVLLGHNDVLSLTVHLLASPKFRLAWRSRYPVVFIDEYQDMEAALASALRTHFFESQDVLIGLFGDHWQAIYRGVCGRIAHPKVREIGKGANFRSATAIVDSLNRMRPQLPQAVSRPDDAGAVTVFHTNEWVGSRRSEPNWKGELPPEAAHDYLDRARRRLAQDGWTFDVAATKILMLTHSVLAREQGYDGIAKALAGRSESFIKKEDKYIKFLVDTVEPMCEAFAGGHYGVMFAVSGAGTYSVETIEQKRGWRRDFATLMELRGSGSIGDVIDHLTRTQRPRLPENILRSEVLARISPLELPEDDRSTADRVRMLRGVPYREIVELARFINERTPFATKHGVKGAEFENVLVVVGRGGWNLYEFCQMLEWAGSSVPSGRQDAYERNRNLFYVACSRPKKRLALLFTQVVSNGAMATLRNWFGAANIHSLGS